MTLEHHIQVINKCILISLLILVIMPSYEAATVQEGDVEKDGSPGEEIKYMIKIHNNQPFFMYIKIVVDDNIWDVFIPKNEIKNVPPSEIVSFFIIVEIPEDPIWDKSRTNITIYERISTNGRNQYTECCNFDVITNVIDEDENDNSLLGLPYNIAILMISSILISTIALSRYSLNNKKRLLGLGLIKSSSNLPFFPTYSRLKKQRVLNNQHRKRIYNVIKEHEEGITFKDLREKANITHPSFLNYHLRRLKEYGFIKNIDNSYYPPGVRLKKPFLREIQEAMEDGARTPTEVAHKIGSYAQKVRYHMEKHNLIRKDDVDE